jgi:hypothetical protein
VNISFEKLLRVRRQEQPLLLLMVGTIGLFQFCQIVNENFSETVFLKRYVEAVMKDLDKELAGLREDPVSETPTGQNKVKELTFERRGLLLFLNVMFELRPGASPARTAATPDTRGSAAAPPTTPSQQAARTPQSTPAAGPAPDGKGPGSSASPSC